VEDYKFVEKVGGIPILIDDNDETVFLSDVFSDMYIEENGKHRPGMEESAIAEKYGLTESQVIEAQNFFRTDDASHLWDNIDDLSSEVSAADHVEKAFYGLTSEYCDVEVEVEDQPENAEIEYRLHVDGSTLQAAVEGEHAYLRSDEGLDSTLKVEKGKIEDEIKTLYNGLRLAN
jgi:ribosome-associated translation inhibitor RaiA